MQGYGIVFGVLLALLVGLAAGKAWERYKLVEGRWIDRRRVRQSPHFILGLNYLVAGQVDLAIDELEKARALDPGALELRLVLGNLYREKGQVGPRDSGASGAAAAAAPEPHRARQRAALPRASTTGAAASWIARWRSFSDVLKLDPDNEAALHQPREAAGRPAPVAGGVRHAPAPGAASPARPISRSRSSSSRFSRTSSGLQALKDGRLDDAIRRFEAAIDLDPRRHPGLSAPRRRAGAAGRPGGGDRDVGAVRSTSRPIARYLALDRLERAYADARQRRIASPISAGG